MALTTAGCERWASACDELAQHLASRQARSDSSISGRIAWRSSVAEITGNSSTKAQPRAQRTTRGEVASLLVGRSELAEKTRCRHSKHAGARSDSQQRLRRSSILNPQVFRRTHHDLVGLPQETQDNQDSTQMTSDLRTRAETSAAAKPLWPLHDL
jgi:hypothetical protein